MNYVFKSPDHPFAVGAAGPEEGETFDEYVIRHPTDDGGTVLIRVGRPGLVNFAAIILDYINDDHGLLEEAWAVVKNQEGKAG